MTDAADPLRSDERLLGLLGAALPAFGSEHAEPSTRELAALHHALARRAEQSSHATLRRWGQRRWAIPVVVSAVVVGGTGTAFAAGTPLPGPLRGAASTIGLPVDSPAVSSVRRATRSLSEDLAAPTPNPRMIAHDAQVLGTDLGHLGSHDRTRVGTTPSKLLVQARKVLATQPPTAPPNQPAGTDDHPAGQPAPPRPYDGHDRGGPTSGPGSGTGDHGSGGSPGPQWSPGSDVSPGPDRRPVGANGQPPPATGDRGPGPVHPHGPHDAAGSADRSGRPGP